MNPLSLTTPDGCIIQCSGPRRFEPLGMVENQIQMCFPESITIFRTRKHPKGFLGSKPVNYPHTRTVSVQFDPRLVGQVHLFVNAIATYRLFVYHFRDPKPLRSRNHPHMIGSFMTDYFTKFRDHRTLIVFWGRWKIFLILTRGVRTSLVRSYSSYDRSATSQNLFSRGAGGSR